MARGRHITSRERDFIRLAVDNDYSIQRIAKALGRDRTGIHRIVTEMRETGDLNREIQLDWIADLLLEAEHGQ